MVAIDSNYFSIIDLQKAFIKKLKNYLINSTFMYKILNGIFKKY